MNCRLKIEVDGKVQGVGFRPFIYREAVGRDLAGHVFNHSKGVTIEAEGSPVELKSFIEAIRKNHPPRAEVVSLTYEEIAPLFEKEFRIIESLSSGKAETLISADIAVCDDCLRDILDPSNRRYLYPFTNCTNCGPRYTIIEGLPYDRHLTSMKRFQMCQKCLAEYNDPQDRRYHAQPNCCAKCGPGLELLDSDGRGIPAFAGMTTGIDDGKIVAIKGLGGFHLACDATNEVAVRKLRERKKRDAKPFAVMMKDLETVRQHCTVDDLTAELLTSHIRPIVLLKRKSGAVAKSVAPCNPYIGVLLPYTPLHHLLFDKSSRILVMTSANISDEPICFENAEAKDRLKEIADYFLFHDRDIYIRTDDSIAKMVSGKPLIMRRARGYVPSPFPLPRGERVNDVNGEILAVGAGLKNTICLTKGNKAFISQHIGDLENSESYESFKKTIAHTKNLLEISPTVVAHDLHPEYFSTKWAHENGSGCRLIPVQHHHAHVASCMAENRLDSPVIGVVLDGTGYGTDGNIWGGEVLIATYELFERAAHFEYLPLPGGSAAIRNPWQMALSYIIAADAPLPPSFDKIDRAKIETVRQMIEKKINSPLTSSCGRLFDAVSSIIGLKHHSTFEGEAAMALEMVAHNVCSVVIPAKAGIQKRQDIMDSHFHGNDNSYQMYDGANYGYNYDIANSTPISISYIRTIKELLKDILEGLPTPIISMKFHNTIVGALSSVVEDIGRTSSIKDVALSGGCFQNTILTEKMVNSLESKGFNVYTHSIVPPNDGGISLGQAVIARRLCV